MSKATILEGIRQSKVWQKIKENVVTDEVFWQNEIKANLLAANTMLWSACVLLISWGLNLVGIYTIDPKVMANVTGWGLVELLVPYFMCKKLKGERHWLKYLMVLELTVVLARLDSVLTYRVPLVMLIPVVVSCRYYSRSFTMQTAVFTTILFAVSAFCGAFFRMGIVDLNYASDTVGSYTQNIMLRSYLSKWIVYWLVASICVEIARCGKEMVLSQDRITREHSRVEVELEMASRTQNRALPIVHSLPEQEVPTFELAARMTPAKEVGGDFYDFFYIDPTHLALMIADVSGKGVPAAMYMMISKLLLDNNITTGKSPAQILAEVNHQLCEKDLEEMFVTVWLGVLNLKTGDLTTASGGHEYPVICKKDGTFELYKDRHGMVLGGMDGVRYRDCHLHLDPGDTLFVYTDGVPEANDVSQQLYGIERMLKSLNAHRDEKLEDLLDSVKADVDAYAGEAPQFDDITMLSVRLLSYMSRDGLCVKPDHNAIPVVEDYVREKMEQAEVPMKQANKMNVAVDELFSNTTFYSGASWAETVCEVKNNAVTVVLRDNGVPFDPTKCKDPDITLSAEERDIGGLGVFMTKKLMDEVTYQYVNGYNETTLVIHY